MIKETLYYDGACPLCSREMKHLAKLKRDSLDLVDIHQTDITQDMPSKEDLLLNLHLKRGDEWVVGADANVAAWQHTRLGLLWASKSKDTHATITTENTTQYTALTW